MSDDYEKQLAEIKAHELVRAEIMPTEHDALQIMFAGYTRLQELGFRNIIYCPKDNTLFEAIEPGSTGIHKCQYMGDWPKGGWWVSEAGDLWPSRPCLFRLISEQEK